MNKTCTAGFSLIEVLVAALLFSIVMLGLINYQQALINRHHYFDTHLQADRIAFQLLESYPDIAHHIVPDDWQYHIQRTVYNSQCTLVLVIITLPSKQKIQQQRLICH